MLIRAQNMIRRSASAWSSRVPIEPRHLVQRVCQWRWSGKARTEQTLRCHPRNAFGRYAGDRSTRRSETRVDLKQEEFMSYLFEGCLCPAMLACVGAVRMRKLKGAI